MKNKNNIFRKSCIEAIFKIYQNPDPNAKLEKDPNIKWQKPKYKEKLDDFLGANAEFYFNYNDICQDADQKYPALHEKGDAHALQKFIVKVWAPFLTKITSLGILEDCYEIPTEPIKLPDSPQKRSVTLSQIKNLLECITGITNFVTPASTLSADLLIASYICNDRTNNYYMYAKIGPSGPNYGLSRDKKDLNLIVTKNETSPAIVYAETAPYAEENNLTVHFADNILEAFDKLEDKIVSHIKQDNVGRSKKLRYTRTLNQSRIDYLDDRLISGHGQLFDKMDDDSSKWKNYVSSEQNNLKDEELTSNVQPVTIEIKLPYTYIDVLHKIIHKCHEKKVQFKFERIASLRKRRLIKKAVLNNEILNTLNSLCNIQAQLVATYYYKKIIENNSINENYCDGIVVVYNGQYLAIPNVAYSRFNSIKLEYERAKNKKKDRSLFTKIKDGLTNNLSDTFNAVFRSNFSVEEIAKNPLIHRDSALYQYVIKNIPGLKVFTTFTAANNYMKQSTNAQFIKIEPAFSHFNSTSEIKEKILKLTITLNKKDELYYDIRRIVDDEKYKPHIIDWNILNDQLNKVPN